MRAKYLQNRIKILEARSIPNQVPGDRWHPLGCDPKRRLANLIAALNGQPWKCLDPINSEKKAQREADLARYDKYFDELEESQ